MEKRPLSLEAAHHWKEEHRALRNLVDLREGVDDMTGVDGIMHVTLNRNKSDLAARGIKICLSKRTRKSQKEEKCTDIRKGIYRNFPPLAIRSISTRISSRLTLSVLASSNFLAALASSTNDSNSASCSKSGWRVSASSESVSTKRVFVSSPLGVVGSLERVSSVELEA